MAKTKGGRKKTTPAGKRTVGSTSKRPSLCVQNRAYSKRMALLNKAKIIFERGILLDDFQGTKIPDIVEKRKWQKFVGPSAVSNISLVKEFYASMDPEEVRKGGPVLVRGHEFQITAQKINAHFETPDYVDLDQGFAVCALAKSEKFSALRGHANEGSEEGSELKQSQLPQWLGFMNVFHSFSLAPVLHRTTISEFRMQLLYSYIAGSEIDVGQVALGTIIEAGRLSFVPGAKAKPIIFPALITALLKADGVEELSSDVLRSSPMGSLNHRSWTDVISKTKGRSKRPRTSEPEFDFEGLESESDEEDADYEAGSGGSKQDQILAVVLSIQADVRDQRQDLAEVRRFLGMPAFQRRAAGSTPGITISEAQAAQRAAEEAAKRRAEVEAARAKKGKETA